MRRGPQESVPKEQELVAELEAQIGRPVTPGDWDCVDVNEAARTITVARDPLLSEIRAKEGTRMRDCDLPGVSGRVEKGCS